MIQTLHRLHSFSRAEILHANVYVQSPSRQVQEGKHRKHEALTRRSQGRVAGADDLTLPYCVYYTMVEPTRLLCARRSLKKVIIFLFSANFFVETLFNCQSWI